MGGAMKRNSENGIAGPERRREPRATRGVTDNGLSDTQVMTTLERRRAAGTRAAGHNGGPWSPGRPRAPRAPVPCAPYSGFRDAPPCRRAHRQELQQLLLTTNTLKVRGQMGEYNMSEIRDSRRAPPTCVILPTPA